MNNKTKYLHFDTLPNRLTLFRILLIPFIIGLLYSSELKQESNLNNALSLSALFLFVIASITDFLDGYFARKRNLVTVFGTFLDPIADKFLVISTLIILQSLDRISVLIVIILVLREVYMLSLRLMALTEGLAIPVSQIGKWKTTMQMIAIGLLMTNFNPDYLPLLDIGKFLIYLACILAIYSAFIYSKELLESLNQKLKGIN